MKANDYFNKLIEAYSIEPKARTHFIDTLNKYNEGFDDLTNTNVSIMFMPSGIHGRTVIMKIHGDNFRPLAIKLFADELGLEVTDHLRNVREVIKSDYYEPCVKHVIHFKVKE